MKTYNKALLLVSSRARRYINGDIECSKNTLYKNKSDEMNQGEWCVFRVQAALKYNDGKEFKKNKLRTLSLTKWDQRKPYPFNHILKLR